MEHLENAFLGQFEKESAVARTDIKKIQLRLSFRVTTVVFHYVLNRLFLDIFSEPNLTIITMSLKIL